MNNITRNWRRRLVPSLVVLLLMGVAGARVQSAPSAKTPEIAWTKSKPGDRDEYVRTLQYLLRAKSYKVNPDGVFGVATKNAVVKFQRSHGLKADGIVGGQTWKALIVTVKRGSKGDAVRALQNELIAIGMDAGVAVDGNFGQKTENAVKMLQENYQQKKNGVVGLNTWGALLQYEEGDY